MSADGYDVTTPHPRHLADGVPDGYEGTDDTGQAATLGGAWGAINDALFGAGATQRMNAATDAARQAAAKNAERAERLAELAASDAFTRSRQAAQVQDQELRQARARAFQAWVIGWLILGIGVEVMVLVGLLVGALWGWRP